MTKDPRPRGWIKRLSEYVLRHRTAVLLAFGAALLGSATQALVPLVARQIVDKVIVARTSALWPWLLLLIGAAVLQFAATYVRRYRGGQVALGVQNSLRNAMHDHLLTLDQRALQRMPTGQLVARANSDSALVQALLSFLPMMTGQLLLMVIALVVMFILAPLLALVGLLVLPTLVFLSYRMRTSVFPASWDAQQREGDVAQVVDEAVNGVRVVKAFGQERRELERVVTTAQTLYGARMRTVRLKARYTPLLESVPVLAQVAVLALGGWMALRGTISIGTFLAFTTYIAQFVSPARMIAGVLTVGQQARVGVERIMQLIDQKPAIADAAGAIDLPPVTGAVEFRDMTFGFEPGASVLRHFDLRLTPGERVAIVGGSGSGKSTVAALLTRFDDPSEGAVLIDGHDLREVTLRSLRGQIAVAFEESFLFSDTVRANIAYGRPSASDTEVEAAARSAQAHEFISALPDGYDTAVGERGLTLSGGQRQRIALARAILADPAILVLDDATSAVDASTEEAIHDALREVLHGRTTLLIAHRLSTLRLADRIAVLEDGRITNQGTHEELLERNRTYRELFGGPEAACADTTSPTHRTGGVTAGAWGADTASPTQSPSGITSTKRVNSSAPSLGAGMGGGGGRGAGGSWRMNLAPTPELIARVDALPPVRDAAAIDVDRESRHTARFTLGTLLREFRRPLLFGLVLVILDGLLGLAGPILVRHGIDDGVMQNSQAVLIVASAAFLGVTAISFVNQMAETFVTGRVGERIMLSLRVRIWAQLQRLSLDFYEREMAGRIMTRMTSDVDQFESLIENGLLNALVAFVTFFGVGIALLVMNLELGLWTLSVIIPLACATVLFRRMSSRLYDLARERLAVVNADFQESLSGVREAQSYVHETASTARFHELGARYVRARVAAQRLIAIYFPFVQFLSAVADAIALGVGAVLIAHGQLTAGALIAFVLYIDMFFSPIQQLSQVFDAWQQTRVSVGRIAELMAQDTLTPDAATPVPAGRLSGATTLDEVSFRYPSGFDTAAPRQPPRTVQALSTVQPPSVLRAAEALHLVDFDVQAGETVALVGETGAGKSTVMKLVARFYDPVSGAVRIDAHDLREIALHDFRTQLGYVPQESFLFSGTIRDNIAYGRPDAADAEVEAAARAVDAHDFIALLPGGYRYELTERGRSLSAGQRQLIALARAELVDPALLLLDEATSNLDLATEARVSAAMQQVAAKRTTIVIAHRLQTAMTADRIIVLEKGRVAEVGSHEELLAAAGCYAQMWRAFDLVSS